MKHYLSYIDEAIKANWNRPALTNYGANTMTYGVVASEIEKCIYFLKSVALRKAKK